jgi:hypothetical protein
VQASISYVPALATVFEVIAADRFYSVNGAGLQKRILQKKQEWKGPNLCLAGPET